ncbi:glycerophosphodiester phosphodiesterase [Pandoraea pneumonica]|uniref:Glycerophosphodiester phosphodiesterase n=1 Tax=Pandoraea pneumonica TaxID=2508299 RepID=A0A5E4TXF7_9BURK|nr:glycerophosphodiester phosphodiesterase family protein [Pandoraea pneumonica]VVD91418.1 glycerophosphodiester phosphodiesterase [Pandoraea pneumonica]
MMKPFVLPRVRRIAVAALAVTVGTLTTMAPVSAACLGMQIHAHRGSATAPENSARALQTGYAGAWDGVETDMQQLSDGTWVLHHDMQTGRSVLAGAPRPVAQLTQADWRNARMTLNGRATNEPPPFLSDVLAIANTFPGKTLNAEIKEVVSNCTPIQGLVAQMKQGVPHGNWFLTSGLLQNLRCARTADRQGYMGLIVFDGRNAEAVGSNKLTKFVAKHAKAPVLNRAWMDHLVAQLGLPAGVHVDARTMDANPYLLDDAADTRLAVFAYAVQGDEALAEAIGHAKARTGKLPSGAVIDGDAQAFCRRVTQVIGQR